MTALSRAIEGIKFQNFDYTWQQLQVEVMFGAPSKNCLLNGLCKIVIEPAKHEVKLCNCKNKSHATLLFRPRSASWALRFQRGALTDQVWNDNFSTGFFKVDEPYVGSLELLSHVQFDSLCVLPGFYPISEYKNFVVITF